MFVKIEFRDSKGWPLMFCSQPVVQAGDGVRIQNFGLQVSNDLKRVCDKQRELTAVARQGRKIKSPTNLLRILIDSILGMSLDDYVNKAVEKKLQELQKGNESNGNNTGKPAGGDPRSQDADARENRHICQTVLSC